MSSAPEAGDRLGHDALALRPVAEVGDQRVHVRRVVRGGGDVDRDHGHPGGRKRAGHGGAEAAGGAGNQGDAARLKAGMGHGRGDYTRVLETFPGGADRCQLSHGSRPFPSRYPEPHDSNRTASCDAGQGRPPTTAPSAGGSASPSGPRPRSRSKTLIDRGLAACSWARTRPSRGGCGTRSRRHAYWHGRGGIVSFAICALDTAALGSRRQARGTAGAPRCSAASCTTGCGVRVGDPQHARPRRPPRPSSPTTATAATPRSRVAGAGPGGRLRHGPAPRRGDRAHAARGGRPETQRHLDVSALAGWTASHACRMARELEQFHLDWLEDALPPRGPRRAGGGCGRRPTHGSAPASAAGRSRTTGGCAAGVVDLVLIDPGRVDGLTGRELAALEVAAFNASRWVPHCWSSAINTAAALHVFAADRQRPRLRDQTRTLADAARAGAPPFEQVDGYLAVPTVPGLGVEVDESVVARYLLA